MKARRAKVKCTYDNVDISRDIAAFLKSFSVCVVLGGEKQTARRSHWKIGKTHRKS